MKTYTGIELLQAIKDGEIKEREKKKRLNIFIR